MEWRVIPSCPDFEASRMGQIRHRPKIVPQYKTSNGYLSAPIGRSGVHKIVSRLVCEAFHGMPPTPKHQAAHRNGRRDDNRAANLRWLTRKQNYRDQIRHGIDRRGENHHNAILKDADIRMIRRLAREGITQTDIGRQFGIAVSHANLIIHRRLWAHVR